MFLYILGFGLGYMAVEIMAHSEADAFDLNSVMNGFSFHKAEMIYELRSDEVSARFSQLRRINSQPGHRSAAASMHIRVNDETHGKNVNVSAVGDFSAQYAIQCGWDSETVWLVFDTGSSDTWATKKDFECKDETGKAYSQAACGFGGPLIDDFGRGEVDGVHLSIGYGSGEKVSGPMGYSDITCGGLSVSKQQVALVNSTYWRGNNVTVGVLGLAYPSLTSAFYGKLGDEAPWNAISYAPFFTTAMNQGTIDPVFSVAISKNSSDGMIAWGGLPPMAFDRQTNASTDLIITRLSDPRRKETAWKPSYYTIIPDGITWGTTVDYAKYPYIVDTGTTNMYLPPPLVEAIAKSFDPPAVYMYQWSQYYVPCNSIPPQLAVIIEEVRFWVNPADLIFQQAVDPMTGYCALGITTGDDGPYILGDVFLQSVVAVFDVGGGQMRFYSRR